MDHELSAVRMVSQTPCLQKGKREARQGLSGRRKVQSQAELRLLLPLPGEAAHSLLPRIVLDVMLAQTN